MRSSGGIGFGWLKSCLGVRSFDTPELRHVDVQKSMAALVHVVCANSSAFRLEDVSGVVEGPNAGAILNACNYVYEIHGRGMSSIHELATAREYRDSPFSAFGMVKVLQC